MTTTTIKRAKIPTTAQAKRLINLWGFYSARPLHPERKTMDRVLIEQGWVAPAGLLRSMDGTERQEFRLSEKGWEALRRFFAKTGEMP